MSNPTVGTLRLSLGLVIEDCNPSFVWSDDSRYLAVPQFVRRLLFFRKQRMLIVNVEERSVTASVSTAYYFQPETFSGGLLTVVREPFASAVQQSWQFPAVGASFRPIDAVWP